MNTNNSGPVDVLAVMGLAQRYATDSDALQEAGRTRADLWADIGEARAAVEEMVEAARGELVELEGRHRLGCIRRQEVETMNRLRAALAKFGGR